MNSHESPLTPILLTPEQTAQLLGISERTLFRWDSKGDIPEPVRPSEGTTRWVRQEIETWVRNGCPKRKRDQQSREKGHRNGLDL
jgi:predicted DNA-binding transcriptional regulator AlpA